MPKRRRQSSQARRYLARLPRRSVGFGAVPMDLHVLDDNPFYLLPVPQTRIERVLAERAAELTAGCCWSATPPTCTS